MPTYSDTFMPSGFEQNQGLTPVFQNIGQQQAMQNAALQEQNNQVQQAGMIPKGGNAQQYAMAMALRNQNKDPYQQAVNKYGASNVYAPNGMGAQQPSMPVGFD